jgi:biopolymer transport protein ExbD
MRASRSIRNRVKRRKKEIIDIDITSLLDILVIMLVFLLKSYNSSGVVLNIPKDVKLPMSNSSSLNSTGVNIQISPSNIWVDDTSIVSFRDIRRFPERKLDHGEKRIIPLYNKLVKMKRRVKQIEKSSPQAKKFSGLVNLIIDKSIKYDLIKKIMYTCADAGYQRYKFVVMGEK